ncbi:gamma-glutamylcyclotransferase family protein [Endozoicomonadaceae bacterium StTr2]
MARTSHLLAVYGTLLKGLRYHHYLTDIDAEYLGSGYTCDHYTLYSLGPYPAVATDQATCPVRVEVYRVSDQGLKERLDELEDYPSLYDRSQVAVRLESGQEVKAWIYHIPDNKVRHLPVIEDGDWRRYQSVT